jgi:hypothetical protein
VTIATSVSSKYLGTCSASSADTVASGIRCKSACGGSGFGD